MKKIYVLFALLSLFMVQLLCIKPVYAVDDGNIDIDNEHYQNIDSGDGYSCGSNMVEDIPGHC